MAAALVAAGCGDSFSSEAAGAGGATGAQAVTSSAASGSGGGAGTTSTSTTTSTGSGMISDAGCSDGSREAYPNSKTEPNIAGCDGGFTVPGVVSAGAQTPQCGRIAGNSSIKPNGDGCSVADLCAEGWHVCNDGNDVASHALTHTCPASVSGNGVFWLTRSRWNNQVGCETTDNNNVVGCGVGGLMLVPNNNCGPLTTAIAAVQNACPAPWNCGNDSSSEAAYATKTGLGSGGVLCCRNAN